MLFDRSSVWLVAFLLLTSLLSESVALGSQKVMWVGCGITKNGFTRELAEEFEKSTGVEVEVRGGGALKGIRDSASGAADIGGTCRLCLNDPKEKGATLHHVAWDALVVIVSRSNPVNDITFAQLRQLLLGEFKNWKELGGNDVPVELYLRRGVTSGVGHMFRMMFFQDPKARFLHANEFPRSSGLIEMLVRKGKGSVGISGYSSAQKRPGLKMLSIDGIKPTKENIISNKYIYSRPLYFATGRNTSSKGRQFVEFALSDTGQAIISREGVVNLEEGAGLSAQFRKLFGNTLLAPGVK